MLPRSNKVDLFYGKVNAFAIQHSLQVAFSYSCERPEQKVSIAVGTLQKQIKTAEEKQIELQEDIRKKQEQLKSMEREVPLSNVVFHNPLKLLTKFYARNY